jgi:hypothetical protein
MSQTPTDTLEEEYLKSNTKTSIISLMYSLIIESDQSESWNNWIQTNDIGIPYCLGVESGDILPSGITASGWDTIDETYKNLCMELDVESIPTVKDLLEICEVRVA